MKTLLIAIIALTLLGGLELLPVMGDAFLRTLGLWEEGGEL